MFSPLYSSDHFDLNKKRTELLIKEKLGNRIIERGQLDKENIIFGRGFGGITDMEVGPRDGYLYILSYHHGSIYRIVTESK